MIQVDYTVYHKETGEIVCAGLFACGEEWVEQTMDVSLMLWNDGFHAITPQKSNRDTQYVQILNEEPVVVDKPNLIVTLDKTEIAADGVDTATLTGLPNPCVIIMDDDDPLTETSTVEVAGGGFTFSTEHPGPYSFEVRGRFPFLPFKTVITAS